VSSAGAVAPAATVLQARSACGGYGRADVVRGVDLDLGAGQTLAVLGPNGAGKSTLVRLLAGLLPLASGEVRAFGRPLCDWRRRELAARVSLVPQLVEFAFPLTVREVVAQGRTPHLGPWRPSTSRDRDAVAAAIDRVGIGHLLDTSVRQLSGGERQLVLLARALAVQPRVLLLDEPAAALDLRHQLELVALVRALAGDGVGVLLVVHDWNLALRAADRVVVLDRGAVAAAGAAREVISPELFARVFGVGVQLLQAPDGPVVVPLHLRPGPDAGSGA